VVIEVAKEDVPQGAIHEGPIGWQRQGPMLPPTWASGGGRYFQMAEELAKAQNELADMRRKQELSQAGSFFVLDSQRVKMNSNISECNKPGDRSFGAVGSSDVEMTLNYHHC
jgi:hypothetical protein